MQFHYKSIFWLAVTHFNVIVILEKMYSAPRIRLSAFHYLQELKLNLLAMQELKLTFFLLYFTDANYLGIKLSCTHLNAFEYLIYYHVSGTSDNFLLLQVPGSTHYSMVFYFVTKQLVPGSLLQRFADGDDEFRNSRFKLIPSVPKVIVTSFILYFPHKLQRKQKSQACNPTPLFSLM